MKTKKSLLADIAKGKISKGQFIRKMKRQENGHKAVIAFHHVSEGTITVGKGNGADQVDERTYTYSEWQKEKRKIEPSDRKAGEFNLVTISVIRTREDLKKLQNNRP